MNSAGADRKQQHTTQIQAACYKVVGSNQAVAKCLFECFLWEKADGAKAGLKLRLGNYDCW